MTKKAAKAAGKTIAKDAADDTKSKAHSKANKPAVKTEKQAKKDTPLDAAVIPQQKEQQGVGQYRPLEIESEILAFWKKNKIYEKAKKKVEGKEKFYFLDGPPYTSGRIHLGHAWNKSLKDLIIRYKRMKGFDAWDRAGYDMHGLPTEHATEKKLGIKNKDEIPKFGVEKFTRECFELSISNMKQMNDDFKRLGVWMDFDHAYTPVAPEFIESEWWLIKQADKKGRLYEGKKTMTWCANDATALAKHELEYENITEDSIFVKFPIVGEKDEFLIIWTTTPWTIPFNLAVMVNPELEYVKSEVDAGNGKKEKWITAKSLAGPLIGNVANRNFLIKEEFMGDKLEGLKYSHPFADLIPAFKEIAKTSPKLHSVILSTEYVDTSAGSGLVHCAPGCGPEDYEVGRRNGLPPYNTIDEYGRFTDDIPAFKGLTAKKDDKKFVEELKKRGALIETTKVEHEYPHCWRCHQPVIFRLTEQWFFKIEDLRENLQEMNKEVKWQPEAAFNAFNSWLNNLRDNSITRQRYWGCPLPVWKCEDKKCGNYEVIGSLKELEEKTGKKVKDPLELHIPLIDKLTIKCSKCKKTMKRVPDILDVWIDAGIASWSCLDYPQRTDLFKRYYPADFILEGKDQIRGWFNLLFVAGMLGLERLPFKACYMHGFINDSQGRKQSKSLGNYILPQEVIDQFGADTLRFYSIGSANPGIDMNYNPEDVKLKNKNLGILWNLHKFLIELAKTNEKNPAKLKIKESSFSIEEKYILSKLNSSLKKIDDALAEYKLNEIPVILEELFLDLSRTYIQLVREKSSIGTDEEKDVVLYTIYEVLMKTLTAFTIVAPFISEKIYQNLREAFALKEESISLLSWPECSTKLIDEKVEKSMDTAQAVIQAILSAREKMNLGVRWPVKEAVVISPDAETKNAVEALEELIKTQTNVKELNVVSKFDKMKVILKPNYKAIAEDFGAEVPKIVARLSTESHQSIVNHFEEEGKFLMVVDKGKFEIKEKHVVVEKSVQEPYVMAESKIGSVAVNKERTPALEAEGYAREITRRVQMMRKEAGLEKRDDIDLLIVVDSHLEDMLHAHKELIKEKVGASKILITSEKKQEKPYSKLEKIKHEEVRISFDKL